MAFDGTILAAMLTPLTDDGAAVAPERLPALVDFILARQVDGLYVGGSTGECVLLDVGERALLQRELAAAARGRCCLVAHVGAAATADAVTLARQAGTAGYDAVAAVPPFYYRHGFDEIADYYDAVADAAGLPLLVYNIPALTGVALDEGRLRTLLEDPRVGGIKFTDKDVFLFSQLRAAVPDRRYYFGCDEMFICAAAAGTDGGIGSTYNLIGDAYAGIRDAVGAGDMATARRLQAHANALIEILFAAGVVPGLKHALARMGVPVGGCRRPFRPPAPAALARLDRWLDANLAPPAPPAAAGG